MTQCFDKLYEHYSKNTRVELNLSDYVTKTYLKRATGVDTSKLAIKFS